jgi:hypothetical protein
VRLQRSAEPLVAPGVALGFWWGVCSHVAP